MKDNLFFWQNNHNEQSIHDMEKSKAEIIDVSKYKYLIPDAIFNKNIKDHIENAILRGWKLGMYCCELTRIANDDNIKTKLDAITKIPFINILKLRIY